MKHRQVMTLVLVLAFTLGGCTSYQLVPMSTIRAKPTQLWGKQIRFRAPGASPKEVKVAWVNYPRLGYQAGACWGSTLSSKECPRAEKVLDLRRVRVEVIKEDHRMSRLVYVFGIVGGLFFAGAVAIVGYSGSLP